MSLARLSTLAAVSLLAMSCGDPVGPASLDPEDVHFSHAGTGPGVGGTGSIGAGTPTPGADRQEFTFDVAWNLTGTLSYRDWSFVRADGSVATITVAADDPGTWFASYRDRSSACADPTRGVEVDGMGRVDTDQLVRFTIVVCDVGPAESRTDYFRISAPDAAGYARGGLLSSGDVVETSGTAPTPTAAGSSGLGAIGPGAVAPGSNRQDFAFEVTVAGGTVTFSDYSVIRNGLPGRLIADPGSDPPTGVTSFHPTSSRCVRFGGTGRIDTGELLPFYIDACDNANPGTGFDTFAIVLPDRVAPRVHYMRSGTLSAGDIALSGGRGPAAGGLGAPAWP
jgi:hypothetical protein